MKLLIAFILAAGLALCQEQSKLTLEEQEQYSRVTIRVLLARVIMYEALLASQMSVRHQIAADDATSEQAALLEKLRAAHGAKGCDLTLDKEWICKAK